MKARNLSQPPMPFVPGPQIQRVQDASCGISPGSWLGVLQGMWIQWMVECGYKDWCWWRYHIIVRSPVWEAEVELLQEILAFGKHEFDWAACRSIWWLGKPEGNSLAGQPVESTSRRCLSESQWPPPPLLAEQRFGGIAQQCLRWNHVEVTFPQQR